MYEIDGVKLYYEPRIKIFSYMPEFMPNIEMSKFESAFLCGLLNAYQPKKILELGVAEGGTTAVILQCMEMNQTDYEMYSVDISSDYYYDKEKETGYVAKLAASILKPSKFHLKTGHGISSYLEQIGHGIDFCVLDTTHSMPGEILDFLAIYPYLAPQAVICLHDVSLCQKGEYPYSHACSVLFQTVTGKKILNFDEGKYPNIAAFQIDSETKQDILDVFCSLMMRWEYAPADTELEGYRNIIRKEYDALCNKVYDEAVRCNLYHHKDAMEVRDMFPIGTKIILYGAGDRGYQIYKTLKKNNDVFIERWVDKYYINLSDKYGIKIDSPDSVQQADFDYVVVTPYSNDMVHEIHDKLIDLGIPENKICRFVFS